MQETLAATALRHAQRPDRPAVPRVGLFATETPGLPVPTLYPPMMCVILQGSKEVTIGDRLLRYDTGSYLLGSIEVPAEGRIVEASCEAPYVGISFEIDTTRVAELVGEMPARKRDAGSDSGTGFGLGVSRMTPELHDVVARTVALFDAPGDISFIAPLIEQEMLFRLLRGPHGDLLRQIAHEDSRLAQVRQAIDYLRRNYAEPVRMEDLALVASMSPATFHRHFRSATAMSPLQFQKALRLQEARRRLIADPDAARAGYGVGYESISQFSREYARMFGAPPRRDAERLRQLGAEDDYELRLVTAA